MVYDECTKSGWRNGQTGGRRGNNSCQVAFSWWNTLAAVAGIFPRNLWEWIPLQLRYRSIISVYQPREEKQGKEDKEEGRRRCLRINRTGQSFGQGWQVARHDIPSGTKQIERYGTKTRRSLMHFCDFLFPDTAASLIWSFCLQAAYTKLLYKSLYAKGKTTSQNHVWTCPWKTKLEQPRNTSDQTFFGKLNFIV